VIGRQVATRKTKTRGSAALRSASGGGQSARPQTELAREWQVWAATNLLRGVAIDRVRARLREEGVPDAVIARALDELVGSPILEAARPFARDARRLAMSTRLRRAMALAAHDPRSVPRRAGVSAAELHDVFVAAGQPVILTDVVTRWSALGRWTPRSLAERFAETVVDVTIDRESDPDYDQNAARHTVPMPLGELVRRIETATEPTNDFYLIARGGALSETPMRALLDEIELPEGYPRADGGAALWLGPAGTVTPLHHDTSNILFCQVHGRKRWKLAAPWETSLLDGARSLYAGCDPERDAPGDVLLKDVVLEPGEALFVPVGWWHHVRALDASISVALNGFGFDNDLDWYRPGQVR
jgi:hypothetical protein